MPEQFAAAAKRLGRIRRVVQKTPPSAARKETLAALTQATKLVRKRQRAAADELRKEGREECKLLCDDKMLPPGSYEDCRKDCSKACVKEGWESEACGEMQRREY